MAGASLPASLLPTTKSVRRMGTLFPPQSPFLSYLKYNRVIRVCKGGHTMMHKTNIWKRGGGALAYLSSHCTKAVRHDSESGRCGGEEVQDNGDELGYFCKGKRGTWRVRCGRCGNVHYNSQGSKRDKNSLLQRFGQFNQSVWCVVLFRHACGGCHRPLMEVAV